MLNALASQSVLVLGLGDSGLAMADWCARQGARVQVWDSRDAAPQDTALAERVPGAQRLRGALELAALEGVQRVLKSPGLAPHDARIAPLLSAARERGIAVQGELDLFAEALAALKARWQYAPAVLAITGTNGKTTTTALTGLLCAAAGRRVAVAGNIGPTLLDTLREALEAEGGEAALDAAVQAAADATAARLAAVQPLPTDDEAPDADAAAMLAAPAGPEAAPEGGAEAPVAAPDQAELPLVDEQGVSLAQLDAMLQTHGLPIDGPPPLPPQFAALPQVWVLELSSFQLDAVQGFQPDAAVVLNLTQDHLDWHGDMAAYGAAKARVFGSAAPDAGLWVINRDDPLVEALVPTPPPPPMGARGKPLKVTVKWSPPRVCRFGLNAPQAPGDFGLVVEAGMAWLVRALPADDTPIKGKRGAKADDELQLQRLMPADALRIRGRHNAANALAALALATAIGCPLAPMLHALRDYRGEPHRVEFVLNLGGVDFVDDSKGTNVGATVAAIAGLAADREGSRLSLLLGGDGKGQDFTPLLEPIRQHARAVALIGRDGPALLDLLAPLAQAGLPVALHADLPAATRWAFERAEPGDTVLLSPACASLDMFKNYAHRAEVFVATAREIAADRGEVL
ncbi:Mur ligase family protein [Inhella crocodyli]|uniref:UDP-N-acetylmuramoylalanine--D-glutamate ligase n=1 Tax=Inhella crocodyli TaxID=2499851 RepID=A0A3S2UFF2_9BURK|nr:Mur ligase family protein [Inhella crocodyli]RVT86452.1 UDP-N-acetylmuramoyl-L-alanine--D-glutamate ligase [Inhella crocodyli]